MIKCANGGSSMATIKDLPFMTRVRIAREHQFYVLMHNVFRVILNLSIMALYMVILLMGILG